ncbi:hypothetical protein KR084_003339 [Drosophila pseudotakahashii]|nr:hypothetical protein KR084_003339 [Drosophila pseudotakahashii]
MPKIPLNRVSFYHELDDDQPGPSKRAYQRKPVRSNIVHCGKGFYYDLNDLDEGEPLPTRALFRRVKEEFDPVSSSDEFPRPSGPKLKQVGKRPPKFKPQYEESEDESTDEEKDLPRKIRAKRTVKKNNPKLAKTMKRTVPKAAARKAVAKKAVAVVKKTRQRKATGVMEPRANSSDELQAKSGESNSRNWWRNWIGWSRSEKRAGSSDMITQTTLKSTCLLRR